MPEADDTGLRVVLTGLKPTGSPHLGNYTGMFRPALAMMETAAPGSLSWKEAKEELCRAL